MLRVFAENESLHRLEAADGTVVGWIRDGTIGFRGLTDERRAMLAAAAAWRSLDAVLRGEYAGWPRYEPDVERLHVLRDGAQEWIADGTRRLARLLRVDDAPRRSARLSLEFDLPSYVPLRTLLSAAASMSRALDGVEAPGSPDASPPRAKPDRPPVAP